MYHTAEQILFPDLEPDINKVLETRRHNYEMSKKRLNNLHLLSYPDFDIEGEMEMPVVKAYTGPIPKDMVSYSHRRNPPVNAADCAVHCFEYDSQFFSTWVRALESAKTIRHFLCAVAPDFSVFVDQPKAVNITNIYRSRWVACFWHSQGIRVIPSASWGNVESFSWCFDGLPVGGIIAIGHAIEGKEKAYRKLFRLGVDELIAKKHLDALLVYGAPLDFDPGVQVIHFDGEIQKMRKYEKDK